MKTIYIPKGESVRFERLTTEKLIVKGSLTVTYGIKAKSISGNGVINAGSISADSICADDLESGTIICGKLIAKRVSAPEVFASECMAVSSFLSAAYVETPKLTVAISEIDEVKVDELINLKPKSRSLLGTLIASAWQSFWLSLTTEPIDADYEELDEDEPAEETSDKAEPTVDPVVKEEIVKTVREIMEQSTAQNAPATSMVDDADFELKRMIAMFKLCRDNGCTLKVIPGTPEENAPIFDFETETVIRPAA